MHTVWMNVTSTEFKKARVGRKIRITRRSLAFTKYTNECMVLSKMGRGLIRVKVLKTTHQDTTR
jgi:hypothetical protein